MARIESNETKPSHPFIIVHFHNCMSKNRISRSQYFIPYHRYAKMHFESFSCSKRPATGRQPIGYCIVHHNHSFSNITPGWWVASRLLHGAVGFFSSSPSTLALLSAVAGSLRPEAEPVPNLTLTPPLPTLTVLWSADCRSALAPPTGCSGRGRLAFTRSISSALSPCSERSCCRVY